MHRPVAILCSGQGGQHSAMFDLFADSAAAEPVFLAAAELLGEDPRRFVRQAAPTDLFADRVAQILCCTQAMATWAGLATARPARAVVAGYSVGELAAWGCAGTLDMSAVLQLAQRRTTAMEAAAPPDSGLAAVVGLSRSMLEPILGRHATAIAIINGPDSFVIGGHVAGLDAACRDATASGATRAFRLPVSVPSHTMLLAKAAEDFRTTLRTMAPQPPKATYRLLSGIDGDTVHDIQTGCDKLARQICTPVNWAACLESCRAAEAVLALELGPGRALSHMAEAFFPAGATRSTEDFRTVAGLRAWLSRSSD